MTTVAAPPKGALNLQEAVAARPTPLGNDGTVTIHIIRPGIGGGRGRHYYSPGMLQENAHKFNGWRVFMDHLAPKAKEALGGLPRSMKDLGGIIEESWWDRSVPADGRFESGAVVGKLRPIRELREVIEQLPQAVQFSIRAKATDVRPEVMEGSEAFVVEGIKAAPGSVDAVTEAGAGGRIAEILEAANFDDDEEAELEEAVLQAKERKKMDKGAFAIPETRSYPIHDESHARNALSRVAQNGSEDEKKRVRAAVKRRYPNIGSDDNSKDKNGKKPKDNGKKPKGKPDFGGKAKPFGKKKLQETDDPQEAGDNARGGDVSELLEALRDPESEVAQAVNELVETRVDEGRGQIKNQAEADAKAEGKRDVQLRDLRDTAHKMIEEADLPDRWGEKLRNEYDLVEGDPAEKLDVVDRVDREGEVTKDAATQLEESVKADIVEQRELLAEVNPTQVRGQGPGRGDGEKPEKKAAKPFWREHLEEAGVDPDAAFGGEDEDASEEDNE